MPTLTGKTALVTGASRGMGGASALALAAAGAQVLVHYGRGANKADGVVAEIRKAGGRADAIATDLAADGASELARQTRTIVGDRLASLSPLQASRKRRVSRKQRSRISISSSRSTFARRSFLCSPLADIPAQRCPASGSGVAPLPNVAEPHNSSRLRGEVRLPIQSQSLRVQSLKRKWG